MQSALAKGCCVYDSIYTCCAPGTRADTSDYWSGACSFEMCESISRLNIYLQSKRNFPGSPCTKVFASFRCYQIIRG